MRGWVVALVVIAACKAKAAPKVMLVVPTVNAPTVLAIDSKVPPAVLLVGDTDETKMAVAATWADFDAHRLRMATRSGPLELLDRYVEMHCTKPLEAMTTWNADTRNSVDLRALEALEDASQDDPPPPE